MFDSNLFDKLGVTESRIRPRVSNDNCFSESLRDCKYRPNYPKRFNSYADVLAWSKNFFDLYNLEHRHSGAGREKEIWTNRDCKLEAVRERRRLNHLRARAQAETPPLRVLA